MTGNDGLRDVRAKRGTTGLGAADDESARPGGPPEAHIRDFRAVCGVSDPRHPRRGERQVLRGGGARVALLRGGPFCQWPLPGHRGLKTAPIAADTRGSVKVAGLLLAGACARNIVGGRQVRIPTDGLIPT